MPRVAHEAWSGWIYRMVALRSTGSATNLQNRIRAVKTGPQMGQNTSQAITLGPQGPYQPTIADIILVKEIFMEHAHPLPVELIDQILDDAEYWARASLELEWDDEVPKTREVADGEVRSTEFVKNAMYMRTLPFAVYGTEGDVKLTKATEATELHLLGMDGTAQCAEAMGRTWIPPRGGAPARKIEFQLDSQDQGWSSDVQNQQSYRGSYTWFDVGIERLPPDVFDGKSVPWNVNYVRCQSDDPSLADAPFEFIRNDPGHPFLHPPTHLQRNIHAGKDVHRHAVTWHYLDSIEEGSAAANEADERGQGWQSLDGNFIRGLREGDCITLWMRARFPGWRLAMKGAKIDIYWAV